MREENAFGAEIQRHREALALTRATLVQSASPTTWHNQPTLCIPSTSFMGRDAILRDLRMLLARPEVRLLTLLGPAGSGKTRLAVALAEVAAQDFDSLHRVALAGLRDPSLLLTTIAQALGLHELAGRSSAQIIIERLEGQRTLLVLDQFEQLRNAATALTDLLQAAPGLKFLVTSRLALPIQTEHTYEVPPLDLPTPGDPTNPLAQAAAVRLFAERAAQVQPRFTLTADNLPAVAEICVRLDGIPFAIELTAAHASTLSPSALLADLPRSELDESEPGTAQQPDILREMLAWSGAQLEPAEALLLRRLGIFADGCTLEAAQALCAPDMDDDVTYALTALVTKHLAYQPAQRGLSRIVLHDAVRDFALQRMDLAQETAVTRKRHAHHYLHLAETLAPHINGPDERSVLNSLENDHANLRQALAWFLSRRHAEEALRMIVALAPFWILRSYGREGLRWLERALDDSAQASPQIRAAAQARAGSWLCYHLGRVEYGRTLASRALTLARSRSDPLEAAWALHALALGTEDLDETARLQQEALQIFSDNDAPRGAASALAALGSVALQRGKLEESSAFFVRSLALYESIDDYRGARQIWRQMGFAQYRAGDYDAARELLQRTLVAASHAADVNGLASTLCGLAMVATSRHSPAHAAQLLGAAAALLDTHRIGYSFPEQFLCDALRVELRDKLQPAAFETAWQAGQALPPDEILSLALADPA